MFTKINPAIPDRISYKELLEYTKGLMREFHGDENRFDAVDFEIGFRKLDKDCDGMITLDDLI